MHLTYQQSTVVVYIIHAYIICCKTPLHIVCNYMLHEYLLSSTPVIVCTNLPYLSCNIKNSGLVRK